MCSRQIPATLTRAVMAGTALVAITIGGVGAHAAEAEPPKPAVPALTLALAEAPGRTLPTAAAAERPPTEASATRPRGFDVTIDFE